jgi:hypothetical protein
MIGKLRLGELSSVFSAIPKNLFSAECHPLRVMRRDVDIRPISSDNFRASLRRVPSEFFRIADTIDEAESPPGSLLGWSLASSISYSFNPIASIVG